MALVAGVSTYDGGPDLANATADAGTVADALRFLGYQVYTSLNPTKDVLLRELAFFRLRTKNADKVVFYFSGQGVQHHGESYLILKDTVMQSDKFLSGAVPVRAVFKAVSDAPWQKNLVLDAYRNNPNMTDGLRSGRRSHFAPAGSFVVYSAQPGGDAFDGAGAVSPVTKAFLEQLRKPTQPIAAFFRNVRLRVVQTTGGRQVPWTQSSILGHVSF